MKIEKKVLAKLEKCYAPSFTVVEGEQRILFATESQGSCYQFSGPTLKQSSVWDAPGGTMSMVTVPGHAGDFLAVQNFFPTFQAQRSTVAWAIPAADGSWSVQTVLDLPYLHRFDILPVNGVNYFIAATICTSKQEKEDWSDPGKIWVGILPEKPGSFEVRVLREGLVRNHGYWRTLWNGKLASIVTCDQGAFVVTPPQQQGAEWTVEPLMDVPIGDIALCDIDGDGEDEVMTVEPFHGTRIAIRKKIAGKYEVVWQYDKPVDFGHVAWGGKLRGVPTFIGGCRKECADLFYVRCASTNPLTFDVHLIEAGQGPSNVAVIHAAEQDIILAANRMVGEAVLYRVTD